MDSAVSGGISHIKVAWFPFEDLDSVVKIISEYPLNNIFYKAPVGGITDDSVRNYWRNLTERYDGDGYNDLSGLKKPIKFGQLLLNHILRTMAHGEKILIGIIHTI